MKNPATWIRTLTAALVLAAGSWLAADGVRYEGTLPGGGSKVRIDGSANTGAWSINGPVISGSMEIDPAFAAELKTPNSAPKVHVTIPVRSLKSGNRLMDNALYSAMKQGQHPLIEYRLLELAAKNGPQFQAKGALTVAGVTRTNTMPVKFERVGNNRLKVTGSTPLKMTDFGIQPPVRLGVFRTDDDVTISFEWVAAQKTATAQQ